MTAENQFRQFQRCLTSSEAGYAQECWDVFRMAVEFDTLYTMDMEEEMPALPFNVTERQCYMIRQTLFDLALQLKDEGAH